MNIDLFFPAHTKSEDRVVSRVDGLRLEEITMAKFKHKEICRGHRYSCEVFSLVLPSILLRAAFELYCRNESLFFLLALPLDILAVCMCISLNVDETTFVVPYGIELRSRCTMVRCTTYFLCYVLSPFYLSVDGLTLPTLFSTIYT